ncbi:hypothetical protein U1Q18_014820 [Sarracenia purpurea var. burkii]
MTSSHCAPCSSLPINFSKRPGRNHFIRFDHWSGCWRAEAEIPSLSLATVGDARPVVFDISSDGEGWVEAKGSCGIGGDGYDGRSELLGDKVGDTETDDSDDAVLVGGVGTLNRGRSLPVLLRMIWMMVVPTKSVEVENSNMNDPDDLFARATGDTPMSCGDLG